MKTALIFSGYNQRTVIALCRYFTDIEHPFCIVSCGNDDPIYKTDYSEKVILERKNKLLTTALFVDIARCCERELVYIPTSEFLNLFMLSNSGFLRSINIITGMPDKDIYCQITDKWACQGLLKDQTEISLVEMFDLADERVPCVIKPYQNIKNGKVLYPFICKTKDDLKKAKDSICSRDFFMQRYLDGQSYYYCAYLASDGCFDGYWQANLLQQPNGKSMVLAKICDNPGLQVDGLMEIISKTGYFGPLMIELIHNEDGFYFIEINPRFWGPLQLCIDCFPQLLDAFIWEWFDRKAVSSKTNSEGFYSWYYGAKQYLHTLKSYPELKNISDVENQMLAADVYSRPDTVQLSQQY